MEWLLKSLRVRNDAINSELDVRHYYMTQWLEEYDNLKKERNKLRAEIDSISDEDERRNVSERINELTGLLKKDKNTFLKNKKKQLFEQESIPAEPIKRWSQLAKKRRRERAAQLEEDARLAEEFRQQVAPNQLEEDPEDRRARQRMEDQEHRERLARIARQHEERLQQIANANRLADEMAREMALRDGIDGLDDRGIGKHKKTKRKSARRRKPKTSKHKKKKNNKSRSSRKK